MDPILSRKLFRQKALQTHKPLGFRTGAILDFKEIARQQSQGGITQLAGGPNPNNLTPNASYPIVPVTRKSVSDLENIMGSINQGREKAYLSKDNINRELKKGFDQSANEPKNQTEDGIMSLNSNEVDKNSSVYEQFKEPQSVIQSKILEDEKIIKKTQDLGKQKDQEGLFSDREKKGIFAANVAIALAQPGDFFSNLGQGLGQGALSLANLSVEEKNIINAKKKAGKADFYYDTILDKTYKVEDAKAMTTFIQDDKGVMVPRFVKQPSNKKTDNTFVSKLVLDPKTGKFIKKDILKSQYAPYLGGDYSKYEEGSIQPLPEDDVARVILEDSVFGKRGDKIFVSKEVAQQNKDILGGGLSAEDIALIEQQALYKTKETGAFFDELQTVQSQARKSDQALFLVKDISERLEFGAKGGILNSASQAIDQIKSLGGFIVGYDREGNAKRVKVSDVGKDVLFDPSRGENYNDVKLAFTNPEAYIKKMKEAGDPASMAEQNEFKKSMGLFTKEFAELNAGLQTNVIQLAYAIAKANEEGGRFSVSDIKFAMDSIGAGTSEGVFKSKLNTVAQRLATKTYQEVNDFFESYEENSLDLIRDKIKQQKGLSLYKRIDENYDYFTQGEDYKRDREDEKKKKIEKEIPTIQEIIENNKKKK